MLALEHNDTNPWGNRPAFYMDEEARDNARKAALIVLGDAGIEVSPEIMALAPDQVLYKLSTAKRGQVAGILELEARGMIEGQFQSSLENPLDWREKNRLMEHPINILR